MGRWSSEVYRIALVVGPAGIVGYFVGATGWFLALGMAILLGWHLWQLSRFQRWMRLGHGAGVAPPAGGPWADAVYEIRRLRRQNRKRKKKLRGMLNRFKVSTMALPYGTITVTADGGIEWFNRSAGQLLGLNARNDKGRRITSLLRDRRFVAFMTAGEFDRPVVVASPLDQAVELSVRCVRVGKKQLLITLQDVTQEHRLDAVRKDFVANVSHELRTPLTVVSGYLEVLSEHPGLGASEQDIHAITQMQAQADRMRRIVEDLLLLSSLESSGADAHAPVPVPTLLDELEAEVAMMSAGRGHTLVKAVDEGLWVQGDAQELHSAFSNLLSNAIRYSPQGGAVELSWYVDAGRACFAVKDHGIGIALQHLQRLTERFYRVDKGRSRETGGTGLGLAIVKHVLQRHGATLDIDSEPGVGSTFRCTFPASRVITRTHPPRPVSRCRPPEDRNPGWEGL